MTKTLSFSEMRTQGLQVLFGGCCLFIAMGVHAEAKQMPWETTPPPHVIEDRFRVDVGVWNAAITTTLRDDASPQLQGTVLSGENDLGLTDKKLLPNFELTLLPGKRHMIRINGLNSRRDGQAVLTRTIKFDNNTYTSGSLVRSTFNLNLLGVGYGYRLFKADRYELDTDISVLIASVEANAYVPATTQREGDSHVVPIPLIGIEGRYEVFRRWNVLGRYQWLGGSSGGTSGAVRDWRAGVQWQFSQHVGVGLHYRRFGINLDSNTNNYPGSLRLQFSGVQLEFRASL